MKIKNSLLKFLIIIILLQLSLSFETNDESISTCKKGPSYLMKYYENGENISFNEFINRDSVHPLIELEKNNGKNRKKYINQYVNRLGPYFTFVGIGGATLICWIILCFCWCKPKCCYNPNEGEPCLRTLMFIISIIFLAGIFACCVSGFVYAERFKKNLNGSTCAIERLYYNIYDGQILNDSTSNKWTGFNNIIQQVYQLNYLENIFKIDGNNLYNKTKLTNSINELSEYITNNNITNISSININEMDSSILDEISEKVLPFETRYATIISSIMKLIDDDNENSINNIITNLTSLKNNFTYFGDKIVKKYNDYKSVMKKFIYICFQTLYSFMLSFAVLEILFLVAYVVGEKNSSLYFIIIIFWYLIMLLSVTSFMIGACYGMITFGIKDGIGYIMYIFGSENIKLEEPIIIGNYSTFIFQCIHNTTFPGNLSLYFNLQSENNFTFIGIYSIIETLSTEINDTQFSLPSLIKYIDSLNALSGLSEENENIRNNLISYLNKINNAFTSYIETEINGETSLLYNKFNSFFTTFFNSPLLTSSIDNPFSFMNCGFIKNDLQIVYKALYDLSLRTRVLTALTLCIAFFALISGITIQISMMRYNDEDNNDYYDDINNKKESSLLKKQNQKINDFQSKNPQITRLSELQEFN